MGGTGRPLPGRRRFGAGEGPRSPGAWGSDLAGCLGRLKRGPSLPGGPSRSEGSVRAARQGYRGQARVAVPLGPHADAFVGAKQGPPAIGPLPLGDFGGSVHIRAAGREPTRWNRSALPATRGSSRDLRRWNAVPVASRPTGGPGWTRIKAMQRRPWRSFGPERMGRRAREPQAALRCDVSGARRGTRPRWTPSRVRRTACTRRPLSAMPSQEVPRRDTFLSGSGRRSVVKSLSIPALAAVKAASGGRSVKGACARSMAMAGLPGEAVQGRSYRRAPALGPMRPLVLGNVAVRA